MQPVVHAWTPGALLNLAAGRSHYLHATAIEGRAFDFQGFPHKSAFCSTSPPACFRATLLTCPRQPPSSLCCVIQPTANFPCAWIRSSRAKPSAKRSFPSAEQGKESRESSPHARGLVACRDISPQDILLPLEGHRWGG